MQQTIHVNANLVWNVTKTRDDNFVAVCDPMCLTMQGGSLDELFENINETIQLLFTDLLVDGELDAFLRSHGWTAQAEPYHAADDVEFDVPINLVIDRKMKNGSMRAAA